jgi:hypothetical protein
MSGPQLVHDDRERDRQWAERVANDRLAELTANLLRVIAGGGKRYTIIGEAQAFVAAVVAYVELTDTLPDVSESLRLNPALDRHRAAGGEPYSDQGIVEAQDSIIAAALRIVAARMIGQNSQLSAARGAFLGAMRELSERQAETRGKFYGR